MKLELRSGETCVIRPSKSPEGLEPRALQLLEAYTERYGIVRESGGGLTTTGEAAIERPEAMDNDQKLVFLSDEEAERQGQGRLFSPRA